MTLCPNSEYKDNRHIWENGFPYGHHPDPCLYTCHKCKRWEVRKLKRIGDHVMRTEYILLAEGTYE